MPDRFPPPWTVIDRGGSFVIQDGNRYPVAFVYYREPPTNAVQQPTRDQAWRIARNIAKLPDLLMRPRR